MTVPAIRMTTPVGPAGAPLVVLGPSLGTSTLLWEDVVPLLTADHRVCAWDLPGHGDAPAATEPFTVGEIADAVAAAVAETGADRILYAGVSLGGAVGLELMLRHPGLVDAAAIICSGAKLGDEDAWRERAGQVRAQGTASLVTASAGRWFAPGSLERRPEIGGRLLHALRDADDESYALCCEALAVYDVRGDLARITAPVAAIWGEFDAVTPEASASEIAEGVGGGRVVRIADASHLAPAEQPEVAAALLREFFSGAAR